MPTEGEQIGLAHALKIVPLPAAQLRLALVEQVGGLVNVVHEEFVVGQRDLIKIVLGQRLGIRLFDFVEGSSISW